MRSPFDGVGEDVISGALRRDWGVRVRTLTYLAVGAGAYHWLAEAAEGMRWFVTCDDLETKPWLGAGSDEVFEGLVDAYGTANALRAAGLCFVAAPIPSRSGAAAVRLDERYSVSMLEHVHGTPGRWGEPFPWASSDELVGMLARLHATTEVKSGQHRSLVVPARAELEAALDDRGRRWEGGPLSDAARQELSDHGADVEAALRVLDRLQDQWSTSGLVVTHGEPHPGNLIRTSAGLALVDWDTVAMSRPERDLWMIPDPDVLLLYQRLTGIVLAAELLGGFRLLWALSDVAAFVRLLRAEHDVNTDTEHALAGLRSILARAEPAPYG